MHLDLMQHMSQVADRLLPVLSDMPLPVVGLSANARMFVLYADAHGMGYWRCWVSLTFLLWCCFSICTMYPINVCRAF